MKEINIPCFEEVEQLKNRLQAENVYMQEEIKLIHNFEEMAGESQVFKNVHNSRFKQERHLRSYSTLWGLSTSHSRV